MSGAIVGKNGNYIYFFIIIVVLKALLYLTKKNSKGEIRTLDLTDSAVAKVD